MGSLKPVGIYLGTDVIRDVAKVHIYKAGIEGIDNYIAVIAHVELDRPVAPNDIKIIAETVVEAIANAEETGRRVVSVISGRMPIWLYATIVHEIVHLTPAVAVYDPKLNAAVVVASHDNTFAVGDVIRLVEPARGRDEVVKEIIETVEEMVKTCVDNGRPVCDQVTYDGYVIRLAKLVNELRG